MKSPVCMQTIEKDMPAWLRALERSMPESLRRQEILALALLTGLAFEKRPPSFGKMDVDAALSAYREWTWKLVRDKKKEELPRLRKRMFKRAYAAGRLLSLLPGIGTEESRELLIRLLYRNIGISLEGEIPGKICVPVCFFASVYDPLTCYAMSGLDAGIICGILGGGKLRFTHRLTMKDPACTALYTGPCNAKGGRKEP